jgi:hypothetical protein
MKNFLLIFVMLILVSCGKNEFGVPKQEDSDNVSIHYGTTINNTDHFTREIRINRITEVADNKTNGILELIIDEEYKVCYEAVNGVFKYLGNVPNHYDTCLTGDLIKDHSILVDESIRVSNISTVDFPVVMNFVSSKLKQ